MSNELVKLAIVAFGVVGLALKKPVIEVTIPFVVFRTGGCSFVSSSYPAKWVHIVRLFQSPAPKKVSAKTHHSSRVATGPPPASLLMPHSHTLFPFPSGQNPSTAVFSEDCTPGKIRQHPCYPTCHARSYGWRIAASRVESFFSSRERLHHHHRQTV